MDMEFNGRKVAPRLKESHPMLIRRLRDGVEELAKSVDLSLGGCGYRSETRMGIGSILHIMVNLDGHPISSWGMVVRERKKSNNNYDIGIRFFGMKGRDKRMLESVMEIEGLLTVNPERGCQAAA